MKKILFRADGNAATGLGHMYRLFALIEIYKEQFEFVFITRPNSVLAVIPEGYPVIVLPEKLELAQETEWLKEHYPSSSNLMILDGYQFDSTYQRKTKEAGYFFIYVDDLTTEHMYADIVINHSPHVTQKDFSTEPYTQFALGLKYAMLRPIFFEKRKQPRSIASIQKVFVSFGGADKYNLSLKATQALCSFDSIQEIHVLLGGAYNDKSIDTLAQASDKVHLHKNLSGNQVAQLMQDCDFAIAPSSTILCELCAVRTPVLSGYFVDNQIQIYHAFSEQKAIVPAGDFATYTVDSFKEKITSILQIKDYNAYIKVQEQLIDLKIKTRLLSLLAQEQIKVRKASLEDMKLIYDWSNDPLVRSSSYTSEPIPFETHKAWFTKKITEQASLMHIIEYNGTPAGLVRYTINEEDAVIGINISSAFRGQKLGNSFLRQSTAAFFQEYSKPILAHIKTSNIASVKSFEQAGFIYQCQETINNFDSFSYKLQHNAI